VSEQQREHASADIVSAFERLLGRQASDAEQRQLIRMRDVLGLRDNDALWLILAALETYRSAYAAIPPAIEQASERVEKRARGIAELTIKATTDAALVELSKAVQSAAAERARADAMVHARKWLGVGISVATVSILAVGGLAFAAGIYSGKAKGYVEAHDEVAAASWANTREGELARGLAERGELVRLATCDAPGWERAKGICWPKSRDGQIVGWRIP